jgi:hypothetical protein
MEASYFPDKCFDRWNIYDRYLCKEKRYEIIKMDLTLDMTGATDPILTPVWHNRIKREGRAVTIKVLDNSGAD